MRKMFFLVMILLFLPAFSVSSDTPSVSSDIANDLPIKKADQAKRKVMATEATYKSKGSMVKKQKAKQVLNKYKASFMNLVNAKDIMKTFQSKSELISYFTPVMTKDLAKSYVETFFTEKKDGLYLKATEPPLWLQNNKPFTLKVIKPQQEYKVIQERNSNYTGHIDMIYTVTLQDGDWLLKDVSSRTY